ncbi:hypothetical protein TNCV_2540291 [Trichonephila clavipes]|nr:hypothetical protein TNCV_2540291 [Trichonephila clavipes]
MNVLKVKVMIDILPLRFGRQGHDLNGFIVYDTKSAVSVKGFPLSFECLTACAIHRLRHSWEEKSFARHTFKSSDDQILY